ncbi:protein phosphatase 1, regulatory subunit 13Ba isoform X1 [Paramormyrops kingsleyae]|uniref:protein phosphatase 1, regulatory subunit 13Ba isoform X1 n=1 Tax=Paramormyrops kingsleyae TaxID=1676925 RepID=UPI003B97C6B7
MAGTMRQMSDSSMEIMTRRDWKTVSPHIQGGLVGLGFPSRGLVYAGAPPILSGHAAVMRMILTVYLSNNEQVLTEVPVTPETTCRDVVEFCKEPGESGCHLAEVWRGSERSIPLDCMMYEHLQKWGPRKQEVKFFLRHEETPEESSDQGGQPAQEQTIRRTGSSLENGVGNPRVELTLSELQEMASRQQQQIEAQQQMLVAKEQRLRYLKQQERRQQQAQAESEKLQRLKDRVDNQEAKLRKIRAMRGQVDYSKAVNGTLSAEIDHINGVFAEKQQQLRAAMLKVEQLTQQLEELRQGKLGGMQTPGTAALELRRLYQELQIRNKLNQDQNSKLQQHKELLNKRNLEVSLMDRRVSELRERLYRKKAELNRANGPPSPQLAPGTMGRVAAVGPYIQVPVPGRQDGGYVVPPEPLKPQSLGVTSAISHARSKSETEGRSGRKPWKVSDLDTMVDPLSVASAGNVSPNDANWPTLSKGTWKESSLEAGVKAGSPVPVGTPTMAMPTDKGVDSSKLSKSLPPSYGTYPSAGLMSSANSTSSLERRKDPPPRPLGANQTWQRSTTSAPGSSSQQIQQRISVPPSPTLQPSSPLFPPAERPDAPLAAAVRPFVPDKGSRPQSPRKGPPTMNSSSIYHMYLQPGAAKSHSLGGKPAVKAVYGKPVLPPSSTSPSPLPFLQDAAEREDEPDNASGEALPPDSAPPPGSAPPSVDTLPRPLSPTKLTPVAHSPLRYQNDELEALRRRLANAPRPLKKRSSITEPEGPGGPNIQKLLYQRFNTLAGGMDGGGGMPFYQPGLPDYVGGAIGDVDNSNTANANVPEAPSASAAALPEPPCPAPDANDNQPPPPPIGEPPASPPPQASDTSQDESNNNPPGPSDSAPSPILEAPSPEEAGTPPRAATPPSQPAVKRTNLKKADSERTGHGLRVKFHPLALLLDASLEGEFDLVQRIIYEVEDPSKPNDEGITPLHNAVCAGHHHIVKFLLDFGVNVNAADSDGWAPLHCAASCNSVHLCKLLVESGAALFSTTISDVETAADKCEEMEEGYLQCSQFLYGVQEKLGIMNKGVVYALWDYEAQNDDELSFREGDAITILRRQDDTETEWWWARLNDQEGYVPRNLLGLYPRIKPRQRSLA